MFCLFANLIRTRSRPASACTKTHENLYFERSFLTISISLINSVNLFCKSFKKVFLKAFQNDILFTEKNSGSSVKLDKKFNFSLIKF